MGSFVAIEVGLASLPPLSFAAFRYDLGAVLLVTYAAVACDRWVPRTRDDYAAILVVVFLISMANGLLFVGQQYTTGGVAAVLYSLTPVLTTGFARGLLTEDRMSPLAVLGLLVGLAGVVLVVRPDPANTFAGAFGKLLVVGSATSVALGSVLLRRATPANDSTATTGWGMVLGALLMHGASSARGETPHLAGLLEPRVVVPLGYLAIVATAAAYAIYFGLLERHNPVQIDLVSYVVPVVAAVAGDLARRVPLARDHRGVRRHPRRIRTGETRGGHRGYGSALVLIPAFRNPYHYDATIRAYALQTIRSRRSGKCRDCRTRGL